MFYREIIAASSENRTKHKHPLIGKGMEFLMSDLVVRIGTTGLLRGWQRRLKQNIHVFLY